MNLIFIPSKLDVIISFLAMLMFLIVPCNSMAASVDNALNAASSTRDQGEIFPRYKVIEPNIAFWKKIYSQYTLSQSVIHDKSNLDIIYDVLTFDNSNTEQARKKRRKMEKAACKKYSRILRLLASGKKPVTPDEKRVAALFGKSADRKVLRRAAKNVRCQRGQKDRFLEGVKRSGAYIHAMREIFRSYGLPEDLCYLPHVESSFRHWARSKCGAAGMWQFMRGTARRFIRVDHLIDERLDPFVSTRAAAEFLLDNYEKLGSWPLAITAYNHGAAGMERALREKGSFEKIIKEYRGRRFKFASKNFYAEFLAAKDVAEQYMKDNNLEFHPPVEGVTVKVPAYVAFLDLAHLTGVAPCELKALNPALGRSIINGKFYIPAGYEIRLPVLDSSDLALAMAAHTLEDGGKIWYAYQKRPRRYRVRRGDTARKIAARHGVSLKSLAVLNGLDRRFTIYAGQYLHLPN